MKHSKIVFFSCLLFMTFLFLITLNSFKNSIPRDVVWVQWKPSTSNITYASMDNCNGSAGQANIILGEGWVGTLSSIGCTNLTISTQIGPSHPAGTITIRKNGIPVQTHSLNINQNILFEDVFTAEAGDSFQVLW